MIVALPSLGYAEGLCHGRGDLGSPSPPPTPVGTKRCDKHSIDEVIEVWCRSRYIVEASLRAEWKLPRESDQERVHLTVRAASVLTIRGKSPVPVQHQRSTSILYWRPWLDGLDLNSSVDEEILVAEIESDCDERDFDNYAREVSVQGHRFSLMMTGVRDL